MRRHLGYTFAEITGVVAIIGLIASIAVPMYLNIRNQAQDQRVLRDLATLRDAVARFYQDTGYTPVNLSDVALTTRPTQVRQSFRFKRHQSWYVVSTPTDMPWNGPYIIAKPLDPPGPAAGSSAQHWGATWAYSPSIPGVVFVDSLATMTDGRTFADATRDGF